MNLFELMFKIGVDDQASSKVGQIAEKVGNGLKTAAKIGAAALGAAAAGVTALTKSSLSQYAEYEQLVGGVETLFEDAADTVAKNAESAFTRSGLSINAYMETVTSFSASLLQSLGGDTEKAASVADMAIVDMSDNANKMGTAIESIQNAYNGFAKAQFQLLDNLKLGYGGAKEEMARLLEDAQAISGIEYDISSYADIVEAIHVIQTEMGITGTTAKEASTTISGSFATLQSAWANLVTGLGNGEADLEKLVDDVVTSAETVVANVLPAGERILDGITELIGRVSPLVAEKLPGLVTDILPQLLSTASTLLVGVVDALPALLTVLVDAAPGIVNTVVNSIVALLPRIIDLGLRLIVSLANGISDNLPTLIPAIVDIIILFADKITEPETLVPLIGAALEIILAIVRGIAAAIPKLIEAVPTIIQNIVETISEGLPMIGEAGGKILMNLIDGILAIKDKIGELTFELITILVNGIVSLASKTKEAAVKIGNSIYEGIKEKVDEAGRWGSDLISNFIGGLKAKWESLKTTVSNIAGTVKDFLGFSEPEKGPLSNFHTYAPDMMKLFAEGIRDNEHLVTDQLEKSFDFSPTIAESSGAQSIVSADSGILRQMLGKMDGMLGMTVTLDSGELVGALTPKLNTSLGNRLVSDRRGVIA